MIRQWAHELFCIFLLVHLQETVSHVQFHVKLDGGGRYKNEVCDTYSLRCYNLTVQTFASQCLITEMSEYSDYYTCKSLNISNSNFASVDNTMLRNNLYDLAITNSHIKIISNDTFIHQSKMKILNLHYNEITAINFLESGGLQNLQELYLDNNMIRDIQDETFKGLKTLKHLHLNNNKLQAVQRYGLKGLINLEKLYLQNNPIKAISPEAFSDLKNLIDLDLSRSDLNTLNNYTFFGLHSLKFLNLSNINIQNLQPLVFNSLSNLTKLDLSGNNIECLQNGPFDGLINLQQLYLQENPITSISPGSFSQLNSLVYIDLNKSPLNSLETNTFTGLHSLVSLNLIERNISNLPPGSFNSMSGLVELDLKTNAIKTIGENLFQDLHKLQLLDLTNNKISAIGPNSFAGLVNLRRLLLNNNLIKTALLGTFKNFPNLYNLQLGNNLLSEFKTGTFSNLGQLRHLNLSFNDFATINVTIFYPLRNLDLLDLSNNNFTYKNYTSLLLHIPNLRFISINGNNWSCRLLTHMLKTFRSKKVNYLFNATKHYTEENVDGIYCTERAIESSVIDRNSSVIKNTAGAIKELLTNLTGRILVTLDSLKQSIDQIPHNNENAIGASRNTDLSPQQKVANDNLSVSITPEELKHLLGSTPNKVSNNFNLYAVCQLIVIVLICVAVMFNVYKKYFQKVNQNIGTRTEFELLNASK